MKEEKDQSSSPYYHKEQEVSWPAKLKIINYLPFNLKQSYLLGNERCLIAPWQFGFEKAKAIDYFYYLEILICERTYSFGHLYPFLPKISHFLRDA